MGERARNLGDHRLPGEPDDRRGELLEAPESGKAGEIEDSSPSSLAAEKQAIRETIENWSVYRDGADWERFATVWHPKGWMSATWFQGPAHEFIRVCREGFERGAIILHTLGGSTCDVVGRRAISQTRMSINQRAEVHGVSVDVVCIGRFYDFLEKVDGRWLMVRRQPIYEKDRLDPVDPSAVLKLDPDRLARFPEGYRHLAYLQSSIGYPVKPNLPGIRGPVVEKLYAEGKAWLAGSENPGEPP